LNVLNGWNCFYPYLFLLSIFASHIVAAHPSEVDGL